MEYRPAAAEATPEPTTPKQYSRKEIGQARRAYITQTYGKVVLCGHSFQPNNPPRLNCTDCWDAFFHMHPEMTKSCAEFCANPKLGEATLEKAQGTKFVKQFRRFITTQMKQESK